MDSVDSTLNKQENDPPRVSTSKILQEDDPRGFDNAAFSDSGVPNHSKSPTTVRKPTRKKIPTGKGKESLLKNAIVSMEGSHGRIKKQVDVLVSLLNGSNVEQVVDMLNTIDEVFVEFTESYARSCEIFESMEGDG